MSNPNRWFRSGLWPWLLLVGLLALTLGATATATVAEPTGIVVDGVIEADYGPPLASDPGGDGNGQAVMDLLDLYVAEDADNYYFAFTINADIGATNWGKYIIYVDATGDANGATSDAWTRNVVVNDPHKPEYGLYSWVDCATYDAACTQFWAWTGSDWTQDSAIDEAARGVGVPSVLEWRMAKSRLGNPGQVWVEVWSTGGGSNDNAQDTINDPADDWNANDWSTQAVLACSTLYAGSGPQLTVTSPQEGQMFTAPDVDVTGQVSPTTGVTVAVNLNGADRYTPTVDANGHFTQAVTLVQGGNTFTVTADDGSDTTTVVRHAWFGAGHDGDILWDGLYHDSRDGTYRTPLGPVTTGTTVTLRLRAYANDLTGAKVRLWDDRADTAATHSMQVVASDGVYDYWAYTIPAQSQPTVLWYRFIAQDGAAAAYYEDDMRDAAGVYRGYQEGGPGQVYAASPDYSFQLTVYDPAFQTPAWMKEAVVYQIFPDRFRDGDPANNVVSGTHFFYGDPHAGLTYPTWNSEANNPRDPANPFYNRWNEDFYGGDLPGVTAQLNYLQSLGVTALYLNPVFRSPSTHKYDTTSFEEVDPHLGGNAALADLLAAAQARGMRVILDGVFNHTSSDSVYFDKYSQYASVGAYESQASPYYDWYTFVTWPDDYVSWWGYDSLPVLRSENPVVRGYFYSDTAAIGPRWVLSGAAGWRLDVGGDIDPGATRDPTNDYWEGFRQAVKGADPQAVIVGEEWGDATPWLLGNEWDAVMNYRFRSALLSFLRDRPYQDNDNNPGSSGGVLDPITPSQLDAWLHSIEEDYAPEAWRVMMNLLGSHDTNRLRFVLSKGQKAEDADHLPYNPATDYAPAEVDAYQRLLAVLQFSLPGAPTVYYGDEVGVDSPGYWANGKWEDDPYNRAPFPWPDTPGYYSQRPGMADHYARLGQARAAHPALRSGDFHTLLTDDGDRVYAYGRKQVSGPADAAVVIVNRDSVTHTVTLDVSGYLGAGVVLTDALNGGASYTVGGGQLVVPDLPAMGAALLVLASGDITPPQAPANLAAVEGDGQVSLTWDAVAGAAGYHLYRSPVSGGGYTRIAVGVVNAAYTDTAVTNGRWYYYVVTALDAPGNEGAASNEAAALPHASIGWAGDLSPASLVHTIGLTPTAPISAQVWISGLTDLPGQGAGVVAQLGYGVSGTATSTWAVWAPMEYAGDVGANDAYSATLRPEMTGALQYLARFSTTGGREWTYAPTAGGQRGALTVQPSSDTTPPATPSNLVVTDWSADWAALAWDPLVGDATLYAYDVFRSTVSGVVGEQAARVLAPTAAYTDTEVTTGQTYYYVVQAVDASFNRSGYSHEVEVTPRTKQVAVTFQVTVPPYTPADATVYVVGDAPELCGWCNPQTVALQKTGDVTWTRTLSLADGQAIQYKYTRGNWNVNEWWGPIVSIYNRHATISYGGDGAQLIADKVPYWRDPLVIAHEPAADAVDVDPSVVISVTLSRYLDPATLTAENLALSGGPATPTLAIAFYHHTEMTATTILLTPTVALAEGTEYTMTLKTGLAGLASDNEGIPLQRQYAWRFRTAGAGVRFVYLPLVLRRWPPLPYQPTLDPIQGAEDGDYEVSWQELPSPQADAYTLQEAQDVNFVVGLREVCTTAQSSCAVTGQPPGTYYYRVRGQNAYGVGPWSEAQAVTVPGLKDQVTDIILTLPQPLGEMVSSWCTWSWCSVSPRLYHAPLPDGRTLVGWTDANGDGRVSVVSAGGSLDQTYDFAARSLRGLVAHDDGSFAILLWDAEAKIMWLSRRSAAGGELWSANIDGSLTSFNPNIGDSRLAYGNGLYAAYFAVHGDSGWPAGHEGDQLTYVDDNGAIQAGGWEWGCSHSMAELVSYHPAFDQFAPTCASDCYASKGILLNDNQVVYASDGNCGGLVSAQLGQIALGDNAWKLVFNALDRPGYVGQGIGLATIDASFQSTYVWLTHTDGQYERDPVLARLGSSLQSDRYLVGWTTTNDGVYWLGVIDGEGNFVRGPEEATSAGVGWGNRDDSFRTRADGSVSWVWGQPSSATLHLFRFDGAAYAP